MDSPGKASADQAKLDKEEEQKQHFITKLIPETKEKLLGIITKLLEEGKGVREGYQGKDDFDYNYMDALHYYVMYTMRGLVDESSYSAFRKQHGPDGISDNGNVEQMAYRYVREQIDGKAAQLFRTGADVIGARARADSLISNIDYAINEFLTQNEINV
jgi:hypothetical protein